MKKFSWIILLLLLGLWSVFSCKTSVNSNKLAIIEGRVIELRGPNGEFKQPVEGAVVSLLEYPVQAITDQSGYFKLEAELETSDATANGTLLIQKDGYEMYSTQIALEGGVTRNIGDIQLNKAVNYALITGTLVYVNQNNEVLPLQGVEVSAIGASDVALSDAKGYFEYAYPLDFTQTQDTVELVLYKQNFEQDTLRNIVIQKDEVTDLGTVQMHLIQNAVTATIRGTVKEEVVEGFFYPMEGVQITILETNEVYYTDSLGQYNITVVLEDAGIVDRTLVFSKQYYDEVIRNISVKGGDVNVLDVTMQLQKVSALIRGVVVDTTGGVETPLKNVTITAQGNVNVAVYTNDYGEFNYIYEFPPKQFEADLFVSLEKSGYESVTIDSIHLSANQIYDLGKIILPRTQITDSNDVGGIGEAFYLEITNIERQHIYVRGSGFPEVTEIETTVLDNQGNPIDDAHSVIVHYEIVGSPGGGVTLYPDSVRTLNGVTTTTIQAGTIAGAVQIRAWFLRGNGVRVESEPIRVAIWGGLPDLDHFSVGVEKLNIPGMVKLGLEDKITAYMGDKYGNPVAPGTVAYFTTRWGYVEGSNPCDELGRSTVILLSASPLPSEHVSYSSLILPTTLQTSFANQFSPLDSSAITTIFCHTYDENQQRLNKEAYVLFSAPTNTNIWVDTVMPPANLIPLPQTMASDTVFFRWRMDGDSSSINYYFKVHDIYGNPLSSGTKILVSTTDGKVSGDIAVNLDDTIYRGRSATLFKFGWTAPKRTPGVDPPASIQITIKVESPNGGASRLIIGYRDGN
jgi:hypothetical protein